MSAREALEVLAKWRTLFAGWQLGTREKGDPEADAVRDHREATLLLRAEVSALALLIGKGIITREEWEGQLDTEARALSKSLEERFPGVRATPVGLQVDGRAAEWMREWRP